MSTNGWESFPYLPVPGTAGVMPLLPLQLERVGRSLVAEGLVDSGATINVLPFSLGERLGLKWDEQTRIVRLAGNLARQEARAVLLRATISGFAPVRLAFAWSATNEVRLILGQTNFFLAYDVQFRRADLAFDLRARQTSN